MVRKITRPAPEPAKTVDREKAASPKNSDDLLIKQLQSFIRDRLGERRGVLDEEFHWPAGLRELAQAESLVGFRWMGLRSRNGTRVFGIRRVFEVPNFSVVRLAGEGFRVDARHYMTYLFGEGCVDRYLVVELISPDEVVVRDCADVLPREWHVLYEYFARRGQEPAAVVT